MSDDFKKCLTSTSAGGAQTNRTEATKCIASLHRIDKDSGHRSIYLWILGKFLWQQFLVQGGGGTPFPDMWLNLAKIVINGCLTVFDQKLT